MIIGLWQEMCYSALMLLRTPHFTLPVVIMLALGIGANMAVLSDVTAVPLRPPACNDYDRLVMGWEANSEHDMEEKTKPPGGKE
jgi:putative ABC transport system permease protein